MSLCETRQLNRESRGSQPNSPHDDTVASDRSCHRGCHDFSHLNPTLSKCCVSTICHIHISIGFGIRLLGLAGGTMKFITHGWQNGCHFTTTSTASTQPCLSVLWYFLLAAISTHSGGIIDKSGVPMAVRRRGSGPRLHVALLNLPGGSDYLVGLFLLA